MTASINKQWCKLVIASLQFCMYICTNRASTASDTSKALHSNLLFFCHSAVSGPKPPTEVVRCTMVEQLHLSLVHAGPAHCFAPESSETTPCWNPCRPDSSQAMCGCSRRHCPPRAPEPWQHQLQLRTTEMHAAHRRSEETPQPDTNCTC